MPPPAPTIVLVPGFMQRGRAWTPVADRLPQRYRRVCLDHETWTWGERLSELRRAAPPGSLLVGYSMGGRLALHAALAAPGRFAGLVTIGASAGIEDPAARSARREADERLAGWMERSPVEDVVAHWETLPVFATQAPELVAAQRPDRLTHDPQDLARLLRSGGQGALEPLWETLPTLDPPLVAVAGERDAVYADAAVRMASSAPRGEQALVPGAGHAAHLERPAAVARLIADLAERIAHPAARRPAGPRS